MVRFDGPTQTYKSTGSSDIGSVRGHDGGVGLGEAATGVGVNGAVGGRVHEITTGRLDGQTHQKYKPTGSPEIGSVRGRDGGVGLGEAAAGVGVDGTVGGRVHEITTGRFDGQTHQKYKPTGSPEKGSVRGRDGGVGLGEAAAGVGVDGTVGGRVHEITTGRFDGQTHQKYKPTGSPEIGSVRGRDGGVGLGEAAAGVGVDGTVGGRVHEITTGRFDGQTHQKYKPTGSPDIGSVRGHDGGVGLGEAAAGVGVDETVGGRVHEITTGRFDGQTHQKYKPTGSPDLGSIRGHDGGVGLGEAAAGVGVDGTVGGRVHEITTGRFDGQTHQKYKPTGSPEKGSVRGRDGGVGLGEAAAGVGVDGTVGGRVHEITTGRFDGQTHQKYKPTGSPEIGSVRGRDGGVGLGEAAAGVGVDGTVGGRVHEITTGRFDGQTHQKYKPAGSPDIGSVRGHDGGVGLGEAAAGFGVDETVGGRVHEITTGRFDGQTHQKYKPTGSPDLGSIRGHDGGVGLGEAAAGVGVDGTVGGRVHEITTGRFDGQTHQKYKPTGSPYLGSIRGHDGGVGLGEAAAGVGVDGTVGGRVHEITTGRFDGQTHQKYKPTGSPDLGSIRGHDGGVGLGEAAAGVGVDGTVGGRVHEITTGRFDGQTHQKYKPYRQCPRP